MLALGFGFFEYWELRHKVTFDPVERTITVNPDVTELDIQTDVYSDWKEWYQLPDYNGAVEPAIRAIGGDPTTGNIRAGDLYFLINGWRLIVNLNTTRINGVLFSDDFDTPYADANLNPLFPATVSNLVQTVETRAALSELESDQLEAIYELIDDILTTNKYLALQR